MASIIIGYGLLIIVLGFAVRSAIPERTTLFIVGVAGGAASVLCGFLAWAGNQRRVWIILTATAVALVLLVQTVSAWMPADERNSPAGVWLTTLMLLLTVALLIYALHGERADEFYYPGTDRRDTSPGKHSPAERGKPHSR